jgi:hypothetical protein
MNEPKLHHYVPRFYLKHFLDKKQRLWVYDKNTDKVFKTTPNSIAAETQFYRIPETIVGENDPLSIEKAFSRLESKASDIIVRIITEINNLAVAEKATVSDEERIILSEFIAAQHFRTLEMRDLLLYLLEDTRLIKDNLSIEEKKVIQFEVLSDSGLVEEFTDSIHRAIWIFAKNENSTPFITSDHPICIKSGQNMWIKGIFPLDSGSYLAFPISPSLILYCKEFSFWSQIQKYDLCVSPVKLNDDMVHHENCGQAFMASRFLISCSSDFREVRNFIPSIGTDIHAPEGFAGDEAVKRTAIFNSKRRSKSK